MKKLVESVRAPCLRIADPALGRDQAKSANLRSSQLRLQVESAASIAITAVSSKNNVTVSVQNSVVSTANYCNSHICILVLCFASTPSTSVSAVRVFTGAICRIER